MRFIPKHEAEMQYAISINECNDLVRIGGLSYTPAHALSCIDPIAYRDGFLQWLDSHGLTTDKDEATDNDGR